MIRRSTSHVIWPKHSTQSVTDVIGTTDRVHEDCPYDCPCDAPKQRLWSQREPSRSIAEVLETAGFARKIEGCREAGFRLANHRLQPLGHLTAARNLSIRHALGYGNAVEGQIVPRIVPASSQNPPLNPGGSTVKRADEKAAVLVVDNHASKRLALATLVA